jgi:hypothetical protein
MSELRRFVDEEPEGAAAELFRTALGDAPSARARERIALGLGLGAAAGSAGDGAGTPGSDVANSTGGASGWQLAMKWLGLGTVLGALGVGAAWWLAPTRTGGAQPASASRASAPAFATPLASTPSSPRVVTSDSVSPAPPPSEPTGSPSPRASGATPPGEAPAPSRTEGASGSRLAEEVASLDRVRRAVRGGDGARALADLARHRREFPRGALGVEAAVLEIEALARAGRRAEAVARARVFRAAQPSSPYAARLRAIVPEAMP